MTGALTLDIDSIAAGGDGVARHEGLVVFVPRTAPGDRVVAAVKAEKRLARGSVESFVRRSEHRVEPPCGHYEQSACGGCQLQHMDAGAQAEAKRRIIRDTLRRIGRRTIDLPDFHPAPSAWRYRHRLTLALRRDAAGAWTAGLHRWDRPDEVFALDDCLITDSRVVEMWREVMAASADLPAATALRATVRLVGGRGSFALEGGSEWPEATRFANALRSFDAVWWTPDGARRRAVHSRRPSAGAADAGGATGAPARPGRPSASFTQVNPDVASALFAMVEERVMARSPAHVIDAYSGVGDLAVALHARGVRVTAVELDEEATAFAAARLARPSRAISARVEDVIERLLPADTVVVNPPRSGLHPRVAGAIEAASGASTVVYVSCDPATLARDLARMPAWSIETVDAFDMFPQTAHVETVVVLRRRSA